MNWKIKVLDLEPSSYCNAACPMCARSFQGLENKNLKEYNLRAEALEPLRPYLGSLERLSMCGNYGDPILNKDLFELIDFTRSVNPDCSCIIHTNGGARNTEWWERLAQYPNLKVRFGIDGLEDTNHLYRRNVRWDILEKNYRAFIAAGGNAEWKFIVFKHNEHQVETARQRAMQEGFNNFMYVVTNRFTEGDKTVFAMHPDATDKTPLEATTLKFSYNDMTASHDARTTGIYSEPKRLDETGKRKLTGEPEAIQQLPFQYNNSIQPRDNNISCYTQEEGIVYIGADGNMYPCCHLGYPYGGQNKYDQLSWLNKDDINLYKSTPEKIFKWFEEVERRWSQSNCLGTCIKVCSKKEGKPILFKTEELKA